MLEMTRPDLCRLLLLAGAVVSLPVPAAAGTLAFTPGLDLQQEYNDNIRYEVADPQEDWITTISPGLELARRTERTDGALRARIDGVIYAEHSGLNAVEQFYSGRYRYRFQPRLTAGAEASYSRDTRPERDFEATGLIQGTATRHRQHYALSGDYALTPRTTATLGYGFDRIDYDTSGFVNYERHRADLGLSRQWTDRIRAYSGFGFGRYDYPGLTVENFSWTVGAARDLSETFSGTVDFGPRHTRSDFAGGPTEESTGVVGQVRLGYQGLTWNGSLAFNHEIGAAASDTAGTLERTAVILRADRRLTEEFRAGLTAGWYLNKSDNELAFREVDEETYLFNPRLRYALTPEMALETAYRYSAVHNDRTDTVAERNVLWVKLLLFYDLLE